VRERRDFTNARKVWVFPSLHQEYVKSKLGE
jgi:hypothetical protein